MSWIARLTVIKQTSSSSVALEEERHRRGEVISIREVQTIPDTNWKFVNDKFMYVYVVGIPDRKSISELRAKLHEPHIHESEVYEGADPADPNALRTIARKKRLIAFTGLSTTRKNRIENRGWDAISWMTFRRKWLRQRAANSDPLNTGNPDDDDLDETINALDEVIE